MSPAGPNRMVAAFGPFEADMGSGELRKHGLRVKLQDQPFQVLAHLLNRAGEVVTRDELRERLWPGDTFVDFDHGLNSAINKLREALTDTADKPRYIETIPRRGYRFVAGVETRTRAPAATGRVMLAVLPFENLSRDPDQEYFTDGMTEEMIAQLGRLNPQRLGVIARTTAMHYRGTARRADEIGEELGVEFLVEGSVRLAAGRVRITAQLIRTSDQTHLWSDSFDRKLEDVLAIQTEVAAQIARSLALELLPAQQEAMARPMTKDPEAYEAYLRGRFHLNRRTTEGFAKAIEFFHVAVSKDPGFALPHAGLADAYNVCGLYGALPPDVTYPNAKASGQKALELDERLAEAHSALAFVLLQYEWNWPAAEQSHRRAIEVNPNSASAHDWYALALIEAGRFEDARAQLDLARALDPLSLLVNAHLGWLYYFERQYERSVQQLRWALELSPDYPLALYFLGITLIQMGEYDAALDALKRVGAHPGILGAMVHANGAAGRPKEARRLLADLKKLAAEKYVPPYYLAFALAGLPGDDEVFDFLERAYKERSGWVFHMKMKIEPAFDRIRADSRFVALMKKLEKAAAAHTSAAPRT